MTNPQDSFNETQSGVQKLINATLKALQSDTRPPEQMSVQENLQNAISGTLLAFAAHVTEWLPGPVERVYIAEKDPAVTAAGIVESWRYFVVQSLAMPDGTPFHEALNRMVAEIKEARAETAAREQEAPAEFTAATIIRRGETAHSVLDVDPRSEDGNKRQYWQHVTLLTHLEDQDDPNRIRVELPDRSDATWIDVPGARSLAAELLSAAARADGVPATYEPDGPDLKPETLADLLLLVGVEVHPDWLAALTPEQREQAADWAAKTHLQASDNDVEVPPRPDFLPDKPVKPPVMAVFYTEHGYAYPAPAGRPGLRVRPSYLAKCGGPGICGECATTAGWGKQPDGTYIAPTPTQLAALHHDDTAEDEG